MGNSSARESIRKLLVLSADSGATPDEKDAAFLMAQKLMLKHNIFEDDLKVDAKKASRMKEVYKKPATDYISLQFWHKQLAGVISKNFRCLYYYETWKVKKRIVFFGIREDTEIAVDVFDFVWKALEYHAEEYMDKRLEQDRSIRKSIKNDYMIGYMSGLRDKFEKQVNTEEFALVLVVPAIVVKQYDDMNMKTARGSKVTVSYNEHARSSGYADGNSLNYGAPKLQGRN